MNSKLAFSTGSGVSSLTCTWVLELEGLQGIPLKDGFSCKQDTCFFSRRMEVHHIFSVWESPVESAEVLQTNHPWHSGGGCQKRSHTGMMYLHV